MKRAVRQFMPGDTAASALDEAARLESRGIPTLVTMLGENVEGEEEARQTVFDYLELMDEIAARGLDAEISIKPTQLGLDTGLDLTVELVSELTGVAAEKGLGTLWLDMESHPYVDDTLELFRRLREGHENVGICLQSYLYRTADDLEALLELGPRIRLVKGAYSEPSEVAFPSKADVDENYLALAWRLLDHIREGGDGFLGLGTHDPKMIEAVVERLSKTAMNPGHFEVEMLYGISRRLQKSLVAAGTPVRVLISYGPAWFPWYMRRLAERPANMLFVVRSVIR